MENTMQSQTMICSTCGCSLIRLGISKEQAVRYEYQLVTHFFCCQGCLELFKQTPETFLKETGDIVVCPTCLAEKQIAFTVPLKFEDEELHFCRCPFCLDTFNKNPQYYVDRLAGEIEFKGLFADEAVACCH